MLAHSPIIGCSCGLFVVVHSGCSFFCFRSVRLCRVMRDVSSSRVERGVGTCQIVHRRMKRFSRHNAREHSWNSTGFEFRQHTAHYATTPLEVLRSLDMARVRGITTVGTLAVSGTRATLALVGTRVTVPCPANRRATSGAFSRTCSQQSRCIGKLPLSSAAAACPSDSASLEQEVGDSTISCVPV